MIHNANAIDTVPSRIATVPARLISLAASNTEILFALGAANLLVGVSKYCDYPAGALAKPRVGSFIDADFAAIQRAEPDLVLTESHLQREIVAHLINLNINVLSFNPISLAGVLDTIPLIGKVVGCAARAETLVAQMQERIDAVRQQAKILPHQPRVYFEEWGNPMIPAGGWEAECVEVAGGINVFQFAAHVHSRERTIVSEDVIRADPDMILVSWPGSSGRIRPDKIKQRAGWETIAAVRNDRVFVIDDRLIVRPGPRIVEGLEFVGDLIRRVAEEIAGSEKEGGGSGNRAS
jgi:iron complex transport system substrate-binding protein